MKAGHDARALIGVDEAGRGPLAGPVVAAAVLLPDSGLESLDGARDSKRLTAKQRLFFYGRIRGLARAVSVAWAFPRDIERDNILKAALSAMRRAVLRIPQSQALVVVDGNRPIPDLGRAQKTVVGGDDLSLSVACASIVAKVLRDGWMERLDRRYPGYGFARHKGYPTAAHREAIMKLGASPAHRMTFTLV